MTESPRQMLGRLGLRPKREWGQNFLSDETVLDEIVQALGVEQGDLVVELGPGLGHLTRRLSGAGARIVAVERERDMVAALEEAALPGVKVIAADAARIDFSSIAPSVPTLLVGNLPYHLTSPILFSVLKQHEVVRRAVFTLQKEVVTRLCAPPGGRDYGLLPALLGLFFQIDLVMDVPRHFFHPAPKVDSAVVRLDPLPAGGEMISDLPKFIQVTKAAFAQRRKTVINSLASDRSLGDRDRLASALNAARIEPTARAETLSSADFARLSKQL